MQTPTELHTMLDAGMITRVIRPLLSGKEAQVYLVESDGERRVAKVYKHANQRTFKHRAVYTEGRKTRNSRDQRAMAKRSRHGRQQDEAAWRSAEVDMVYRLRDAGVRVPTPHGFFDGVLLMEIIQDAHGEPAPRLCEVDMSAEEAEGVFDVLIGEVVKMLCAGVVHGDLSDFNVLMDADGPVIIDFPQSLNAADNQAAESILARDVANLNRFLLGFGPNPRPLRHAQEMWALFANGELRPNSPLTGEFEDSERIVDMEALHDEIEASRQDVLRRRGELD